MTKMQSGCVVCGFPCIGTGCPYHMYEATFCDECGDEISDDVFSVDDKDLCEYCLKEKFKKER